MPTRGKKILCRKGKKIPDRRGDAQRKGPKSGKRKKWRIFGGPPRWFASTCKNYLYPPKDSPEYLGNLFQEAGGPERVGGFKRQGSLNYCSYQTI